MDCWNIGMMMGAVRLSADGRRAFVRAARRLAGIHHSIIPSILDSAQQQRDSIVTLDVMILKLFDCST